MECQATVSCSDGEYVITASSTKDALKMHAERVVDACTWSGEFAAAYVEEITSKTGSFKRFPIFCKMLQAALSQATDSVLAELLTLDDLQHLETTKQPPKPTAGTAQPRAPTTNSKRYFILTYAAEFDRVHYPLPLVPEETTVEQLRGVIRNLREQLHLGGGAATTSSGRHGSGGGGGGSGVQGGVRAGPQTPPFRAPVVHTTGHMHQHTQHTQHAQHAQQQLSMLQAEIARLQADNAALREHMHAAAAATTHHAHTQQQHTNTIQQHNGIHTHDAYNNNNTVHGGDRQHGLESLGPSTKEGPLPGPPSREDVHAWEAVRVERDALVQQLACAQREWDSERDAQRRELRRRAREVQALQQELARLRGELAASTGRVRRLTVELETAQRQLKTTRMGLIYGASPARQPKQPTHHHPPSNGRHTPSPTPSRRSSHRGGASPVRQNTSPRTGPSHRTVPSQYATRPSPTTAPRTSTQPPSQQRPRFNPTQYVEHKRRQQQEVQQRLRTHPNQRSGAPSPALSRASSWASSTASRQPRYLQPIGHVRGSPRGSLRDGEVPWTMQGHLRGGASPRGMPLQTLSNAERNIADIDSRLHALQNFLRAAAQKTQHGAVV